MKRAISLFRIFVLFTVLAAFCKTRAQSAGPDGHYYKIVLEPNLLWEEARIKAAESTLNGVHGYLATIHSLEEDQFIQTLRMQASSNSVLWIGGSQHTNAPTSAEGWVWVNGEGIIAGQNGGETYANWLPGEPEDAAGPNSEQFLAIGSFSRFGWSSEADDHHVQGYVIEYPGAGVANKISVVTINPIAIEDPARTRVATFEFRREGDLSLDLPVFYSISGTAQNSIDYDEIPQSIIIPAGESAARLNIVPRVNSGGAEPMETVGIRIEPSPILTPEAAYTISLGEREAAAVIYESNPPALGALELAVPARGSTFPGNESVILLAALSYSNQVPTVDFYATDIQLGTSNKLGSAFGIHRTNELAFYRLAWTNTVPGNYLITALTTNNTAGRRLSSLPFRLTVLSPTNPPLVRIRAVTPLAATAIPNAEYAFGYFEVSRVGSTAGDLQVHYTISGDATMGVDYEPIADYVVIGSGRTVAKIPVNAYDDDLPEPTELVTLSLINATNEVTPSYVIDSASSQASVQILDNDTNVIVSIEPFADTTSEPLPPFNSAGAGEFTIRRVGPTTDSLRVYFEVGGTASWPADYYFSVDRIAQAANSGVISNSVVIPAGVSEIKLVVIAWWDGLLEGDETVVASLIPARPGDVQYIIDLARHDSAITIHDEDTGTSLPVITLETAGPEASEPSPNSNNGRFILRRSGPTNSVLTAYVLYGGTAVWGTDYQAISNSVQFLPGQAEVNLWVTPTADSFVEGDETVIATLAESPTNAPGQFYYVVDAAKNRGVVTIHDAQPVQTNVVVSIEPFAAETSEPLPPYNSAGAGEFTLRRTGPPNDNLPVLLNISGTASWPKDFYFSVESAAASANRGTISNIVVLPAGMNEMKLIVVAWWDGLLEGDETVIASVVAAPAGNVQYVVDPQKPSATVIIHDEDAQTTLPVLTLETAAAETSEPNPDSTPGRFVVRRTGPTDTLLTAYVAYGGSATAGLDYTSLSNSVRFLPGQSQVDLLVTPFADSLFEPDETVTAELLESPTNNPGQFFYVVDAAKSHGTITIHDSNVPSPTNIVISVEATAPETWEPNPRRAPAEFTITRTGPLDVPLTVYMFLGGTATRNLDYIADTNSVEFLPGHSKVIRYVNAVADTLAELDETVFMQIVGRGSFYTTDPAKQRATVTIHDTPPTNALPAVTILQPADGAVFLQNELIPVIAEASSLSGTITKLELLVDVSASSTTGPRLEVSLGGFDVGEHLMTARATDSLSNVVTSTPVRILIRPPETVSFVQRELPETYTPGVGLSVAFRVTPPEGAHAWAVEDRPPAGWQVSQISGGGSFDAANQKVKFGPYTDSTNAILSYSVVPSSNSTGRVAFIGSSSLNGAIYPVAGDDSIVLVQRLHPADLNSDSAISLAEVTACAAAWKEGRSWPGALNPIPVSYVTSAGSIWKRGEAYTFDPSRGPAPACWVPIGSSTNAAFTAQALTAAARSVIGDLVAGQPVEIRLAVTPPAATASCAVEEKPPRGWTVTKISDKGSYDPVSGSIRWGVFFDATSRVLTYSVTPPPAITSIGVFNGEFSCDGSLMPFDTARTVTVNGDSRVSISGFSNSAAGVTLSITGPAGQPAVIERSADFQNWSEVQSIYIPAGQLDFAIPASSTEYEFFRLRVQ